MTFSRLIGALALVVTFQVTMPSVAAADAADEVLYWNTVAIRTTQASPTALPGQVQPRALAIVHASIFDALNGIERKYEPIHVDDPAPRRASKRAAVVQAAYTSLVTMFNGQKAALDADLAMSLAEITDSADAIQRGRAWGEQVAFAIVAWRNITIPPPAEDYVGSTVVGKWRPTPPGFLPGGTPLLATLPTFVIPSSSSFRPAGPPPLTSLKYATAFIEVKLVGEIESAFRTADQTESASFWALSRPAAVWNRAAQSASLQKHLNLSKNARVFALLNMAMADSALSAWDSKFFYSNWRPITAIRLADTDSNPLTIADPDWTPLIVTPPYPDYYSGHQSISGAAQEVLTEFFGKRMGFEAFSEGLPGVLRSWPSFSAAADEANMSRNLGWYPLQICPDRLAHGRREDCAVCLEARRASPGRQPLKWPRNPLSNPTDKSTT